MKSRLMLLPLLFMIACHNTNPEKGSGGNRVEEQTVLGSKSIVDSAKSVLDQSYTLRNEFENGLIGEKEFQKASETLNITFQSFYGSLSPADTMEIHQYRLAKEASLQKKAAKNNH
ncbi:hypothetical protein QWY86_12740 [Pedobacter aquatilis]|uniref:hypothetical protein n=1 Tax=Pedobacter aquatilis TaxID=351343 RepID=UPI0025B2D8EB|nr:hypothetical protein [Pedobacter aquatilis]MDN3587542.1 hypothetical protein [Pedobacter aquatilis]